MLINGYWTTNTYFPFLHCQVLSTCCSSINIRCCKLGHNAFSLPSLTEHKKSEIYKHNIYPNQSNIWFISYKLGHNTFSLPSRTEHKKSQINTKNIYPHQPNTWFISYKLGHNAFSQPSLTEHKYLVWINKTFA